jgi:hypothetical protein
MFINKKSENKIFIFCKKIWITLVAKRIPPILFNINLRKSLYLTIFCDIYILAIKIWINIGGNKLFSANLILQIQSFYLRESKFNYPFSPSKGNTITW